MSKFKMPPYLYHGTTEQVARLALSDGLSPRSVHGNESTWEHTVPSHPDCVYLTDIYAPYFAGTSSYGDNKWGVIEIDTGKLKRSKFRPDEDALEQGTRNLEIRFDRGTMSMQERTAYFRDHQDDFKDMWKLSLENLGTVAYKGVIPPEAIRRVSIYDWQSCGFMSVEVFNVMIILQNHRWMKERYANFTRWFMGEAITAAEYFGDPNYEHIIPPESWNEISRDLSENKGREIINNY